MHLKKKEKNWEKTRFQLDNRLAMIPQGWILYAFQKFSIDWNLFDFRLDTSSQYMKTVIYLFFFSVFNQIVYDLFSKNVLIKILSE